MGIDNGMTTYYVGTNEKWVIAECPKCGRNHKMRMFFTGKRKPKKFCKYCKKSVLTRNDI